jgi:hypothetical protein
VTQLGNQNINYRVQAPAIRDKADIFDVFHNLIVRQKGKISKTARFFQH